MHHTAEYGVAAHWKYKQGLANKQLGTEETFDWVRQSAGEPAGHRGGGIRPLPEGGSVRRRGLCLYPRRRCDQSLPAGATPIDFAYAIHSAVGNRMTGAKVNGRIVAFDYRSAHRRHRGGHHLQRRQRPQPGLDEAAPRATRPATRSASGSRRRSGRRTSPHGRATVRGGAEARWA